MKYKFCSIRINDNCDKYEITFATKGGVIPIFPRGYATGDDCTIQ